VLYKFTNTGKVQQWQIVVKDNTFYTIEGLEGGVLTTSTPTVCIGKNKGKKNETTDVQQAFLEAVAKHKHKLDKGYNVDLSSEKKFFEPMLAQDYKKSKDIDFNKYRIFVQPKLDGLRCISEKNTLMSRNGKPYLAAPHLYQDQVILDGELYNHEYHDDFNKIVSLCKKQKPTQEELDESKEKVQHWVYDFPGFEGTFSKRHDQLLHYYFNTLDDEARKSIKLVPTHEVYTVEEIEQWHNRFLELGYEGTIVRIDLGNYENKRSKQLLKYKDFVDEEFKIVGVIEGVGNRTGTIGKFVMDLGDGSGKTFHSNIKGDFGYLGELLRDKDSLIGKTATIKYFNRTPDNIPRFPYVIKIDREEYE